MRILLKKGFTFFKTRLIVFAVIKEHILADFIS